MLHENDIFWNACYTRIIFSSNILRRLCYALIAFFPKNANNKLNGHKHDNDTDLFAA